MKKKPTKMKKMTCRFGDEGDWDQFEDFVLSTYPTGCYAVDDRTTDERILIFYGWDAQRLRALLTGPAAGVKLESLEEVELSDGEWSRVKAQIESELTPLPRTSGTWRPPW